MSWWQILTALCGGIVSLGGAVSMILKAAKPLVTTAERLNALEKQDKQDALRLRLLEERQEAESRAVLKALTAIINHMIEGNGVNKMKEVREELSRYLIEH